MGAPGDDDEDKPHPPGEWPPATEEAAPTGATDADAPGYVPPPADPARDTVAAEVPPAGLYPPSPAAPGAPAAGEEPLLPAELATDGALQAAVGAPSARARRRAATEPRRDDDLDEPASPKRGKKAIAITAVAVAGGISIGALAFLGHANAQHYAIACTAARVVAQQGRAFPPWGARPLTGPEWAPIALPPNAECQPRETDDTGELGKWYLELLLDRANTTLTSRALLDAAAAPSGAGGGPTANPLDVVSAQLEQALLLARDPDRRDERKEVTRLQGDVEYWRAAARLRDASAILLDAAKQFDAANAQRPRHATDAAAWSSFLHRVADELHAGPSGAPGLGPNPANPASPAGAGAPDRPPAPVGTALPVEPADGSAATPAPPSADAGVPSGGVLL